MILIADSGSTKTHWQLLNAEGTVGEPLFTAGINPFYQSQQEITDTLQNELMPKVDASAIDTLYFYGAGCSQADKIEAVQGALQQHFPGSTITVDHDLLAAARALCLHRAGIACILGTGSNSCWYNGESIVDHIPSLGFMLGDEGSGGYLGRRLLQAYYYRELPDQVRLELEARYDMDRGQVLNRIYSADYPNRVVSGFTAFAMDRLQEPFIHQLVKGGFEDFVTRHVLKYEQARQLPIHFMGSVALLGKTILEEVLQEQELTPGRFIKSPMEGLITYHQQLLKP